MKILSWSRRWSSASCFWMDLPDRGLIAAHGRDVVSAGPKALAREVLAPSEVSARDVNGTLALYVPDHLGHCSLRGNGDQHVDVVHLEVALLHPALALLREVAEQQPQILAELDSYRALRRYLGIHTTWDLALPLGVGSALAVVHGSLLGLREL